MHVSFEVKPNNSVSQPSYPERTRGFSAFVALTAARYSQLQNTCQKFRRNSWLLAALLVATYLFAGPHARGIWDVLVRLTLPFAVLIAILLLVPSTTLFSGPHAARRQATLRRLNRERQLVGLENTIDPAMTVLYERIARQWERLENSLQAEIWTIHSELRMTIDGGATDAFADLVAMNFVGHPVDAARELEAKMSTLANRVEILTNALSAYPREHPIEELPSGYPEVCSVFEALAALDVEN